MHGSGALMHAIARGDQRLLSSYMNRAQPLSMITMWNAASWRCHPVPFSGARFAFTSCASAFPAVAWATPRSRYRKKSRSPSPL